jgi:hypothetical protein
MRVANTTHASRPWRIHELTGDFRLEDVYPAMLREYEHRWNTQAQVARRSVG